MGVKVKRVYDNAEPNDGYRVLIDRLWPRGVAKEEAAIDEWAKDLAPSKELFTWFHEDKVHRFEEFEARYQLELNDKKDQIKDILAKHKLLTLVTSVKDVDHSHIPTLLRYFESI